MPFIYKGIGTRGRKNSLVLALINKEYISFTKISREKPGNDDKKEFLYLRALDLFRFLRGYICKLSQSLISDVCKEIKKYFPNIKFNKMKLKGVFPVSNVNSMECLSEREDFYGILCREYISNHHNKIAKDIGYLLEWILLENI